jgi:predicted ATPase/DNA-binding SARP family transcriptional activator
MVYARGGRAGGHSLMFEFRILGPVQAVRDGRELDLGGPRRRAVLALLLVAAGRVVPAGRLAEEVWGGCPPRGAAGTLRSYVSRLRTLLAPDADLIGRGGGYAIAVGPDQLDASRFERLVGAGRAALERGEAAVAAGRFREGLGLWRGRALADVAGVGSLALEGGRLEELRLVAVEGRIEADIELGLAAEVTGELEGLVAEHRVRERLWRLLVLALYRGERQADALAAYRRARVMLADELGIEPGEELRRLEQAVLRQEVPAAAPRRERHNLPVQLTSFVGRERELAALAGLVGAARLVTLTGSGGAGKTRLALQFAAGAVERFRDGAWVAGLAGVADPALVPPLVMEALGVRQTGEVPVIEALRYRLRSAELLLVLDNCEHLLGACAELAVALLRGSPGLRVLATSREPLGVPGEAVCPVPPLAVPPETAAAQALARAPAVRLFLARASSARAGVEAAPVAVVARICRELDGLPLAIELAAARASVLSVQEIAAHLADKFRFLTYQRPAADPRHQALKAAIGWSYEPLPEEQRRVFRALSVFAGGFGLAAVAVVCCGGDEAAALDLVDQLASKSLVVAEPGPGGTRYRLLETIRQYAADRLAEAGEAEQARQRHAAAFLQLAERERQLPVLLREQDNFRAALDHALLGGGEAGPRLARALGGFWLARGLFQEGQAWLERALSAGAADELLRAELLRQFGALLHAAGDMQRAQAALAEGLQAAAAAGARSVQARIQVLLADIHANQVGKLTEALEACQAAAALLEAEGDLEGLADAWLLAGKVRFWGADPLGAQEALERAAAYARRSANHRAEQESTSWLLFILISLPIPVDVAISRGERLLEAACGDPWAEAAILLPLSGLYGYAGRFADARAADTRAEAIFTRSGAKLQWAICAVGSGRMEMIAGNYAAAEQDLREGYEALRALGERGRCASAVTWLAEAAYAQGRLGQAQRLTEEAEALAGATDDYDAQGRWRATRAKLLARRGQHPAAARLAGEAVACVPAPGGAPELAEFLEAQAEVLQLAGALDQAEASLRRALRFYQDRRMVPLAERARAALASLADQSAPH